MIIVINLNTSVITKMSLNSSVQTYIRLFLNLTTCCLQETLLKYDAKMLEGKAKIALGKSSSKWSRC